MHPPQFFSIDFFFCYPTFSRIFFSAVSVEEKKKKMSVNEKQKQFLLKKKEERKGMKMPKRYNNKFVACVQDEEEENMNFVLNAVRSQFFIFLSLSLALVFFFLNYEGSFYVSSTILQKKKCSCEIIKQNNMRESYES